MFYIMILLKRDTVITLYNILRNESYIVAVPLVNSLANPYQKFFSFFVHVRWKQHFIWSKICNVSQKFISKTVNLS